MDNVCLLGHAPSPSPLFPIGSGYFRAKLSPYKYPKNLIPVILPAYTAYEDRTDSVFRNVGIQNSDAGELPKRNNTTFRRRRNFEIKNNG
jgi:hypothetical protein